MKHLPRKRPGKRLALTLLVLFIVLLAVCAVLGRVWIRHSALAWYGTQITGSSVDTAFDSSFTDFNQQLKADGVKLAQVPTETVNLPCSTGSYHHFRVTVQCIKSRVVYASPSVPDKAIANWPSLYKTLTTHMTGGVSNVASISNVAPSTLFVYQPKPTGFPENDVRLVGQEAKVACSIDMIADAPHAVTTRVTTSSSISTMRPAGLLMTEHCERDVNFFGGWSYCSNHPCKPD